MSKLISNPFLDSPKTYFEAAFWFTVMMAIGVLLGLVAARFL